MTHVAHPYALRLGIVNDWKSRWFDQRQYKEFLKTDTLLRAYMRRELKDAYIESIEIERSPGTMHVILKTSQPGLLIGRSGEGAEKLKEKIRKFVQKHGNGGKLSIKLSIEEVRFPETRANIVAQMMAHDLEKRMPFRRVMKTAIEKVMSNKNVKGVKVALKGRLDGAEMGRYEWLKRGRIPLQTLRADIDFAEKAALLPYGTIGIKVWVYRGEVFTEEQTKKEV